MIFCNHVGKDHVSWDALVFTPKLQEMMTKVCVRFHLTLGDWNLNKDSHEILYYFKPGVSEFLTDEIYAYAQHVCCGADK